MWGERPETWGRSRYKGDHSDANKACDPHAASGLQQFPGVFVSNTFWFQRAFKVAFLPLSALSPSPGLPPSTHPLSPPRPHCCSQLRGPMRSARNTLPAQLLKLPLFPEMQVLTPSRSLLPLSRGEGVLLAWPCNLPLPPSLAKPLITPTRLLAGTFSLYSGIRSAFVCVFSGAVCLAHYAVVRSGGDDVSSLLWEG